MSFNISKRNLSVIGISAILIISGSLVSILNNYDSKPVDLGHSILDFSQETVAYSGSLIANLTIEQQDFNKGDNIPFTLDVQIDETRARLNYVSISVKDIEMNRTADQYINIDNLYDPGGHSIDLEIKPGFNKNGFVALTNKNYTLLAYTLHYVQIHVVSNVTGDLNHNLFGHIPEVYEQAANLSWEIQTEINATATIFQNNTIAVLSSQENAIVSIITEIETTGYTRIFYNISGLTNSSIEIGIDKEINIYNNSYGYFPLGNYQDKQNLTIFFNITNSEDLNLDISIPTQKIAILTVIANDHWNYISDDGRVDHGPSFHLDQSNSRFSSIMNITFIEVANVDFEMRSSTAELAIMRIYAASDVGVELKLNGSWKFGIGSQEENAGADIMLILSNRTMTNLGVVSSTDKNVAIAVQGSLNTGEANIELRLSSIMADNLIQHELSHIFYAPDRWTDTDEASVMTKSRGAIDFIVDISSGSFWLNRINWLEQDIQTMVDNTEVFLLDL